MSPYKRATSSCGDCSRSRACGSRDNRPEVRVAPPVMTCGHRHRRCPGYYVALQESDVFLRRLLALEDLRIERKPSVSWNDLIAGYELRGFAIAVGQGRQARTGRHR